MSEELSQDETPKRKHLLCYCFNRGFSLGLSLVSLIFALAAIWLDAQQLVRLIEVMGGFALGNIVYKIVRRS